MTKQELANLQDLRQAYSDKGDYVSANIVTALICAADYYEDNADIFYQKRAIQNLTSALDGLVKGGAFMPSNV